jgi:hypothetical protein
MEEEADPVEVEFRLLREKAKWVQIQPLMSSLSEKNVSIL